jgi:hypothetical protein
VGFLDALPQEHILFVPPERRSQQSLTHAGTDTASPLPLTEFIGRRGLRLSRPAGNGQRMRLQVADVRGGRQVADANYSSRQSHVLKICVPG